MKSRNFCDEKAALMVPLENLNYPYYREVNFYPKNKAVLLMRFEVLNSLIIMSSNFLKYMTDFLSHLKVHTAPIITRLKFSQKQNSVVEVI